MSLDLDLPLHKCASLITDSNMHPSASIFSHVALVLLFWCLCNICYPTDAAVYTPSHTADPGSGTGTWGLGVAYTPFSIFSSDQVIFRYPANQHTVNISPTASCSNIGTEVDTPGQTSYTFDPMTYNSGDLANGGTITFVCSIGSGSHCNSGMIVTVTVAASTMSPTTKSPVSTSSPTPPTHAPTQSPLAAGATHSPSTLAPTTVSPTIAASTTAAPHSSGSTLLPSLYAFLVLIAALL